MLKLHSIDAELAGHSHQLDTKLQRLCGNVFSLMCACLPSLTTWEWTDQQHFAKTKMGTFLYPQFWMP